MTQPGDAHTLTHLQIRDPGPDGIDSTDDFMPRDDGQLRIRKFPVDQVQVGAAHAAGEHRHADLARPGLSVGEFRPFKGTPELPEYHRVHSAPLNGSTVNGQRFNGSTVQRFNGSGR
jgi:hypothetical protein